MRGAFSEDQYENAVIELFVDTLGYQHVYGPDVERDYSSPFLEDSLENALRGINRTLPDEAIADGLARLRSHRDGSLLQKNMLITDWLQNGLSVKYFEDGEERSAIFRLLDYEDVNSNEFIIANQWTYKEFSEKRPDVVLFVNGLPLVVMELKSPSREETDVSGAYRQLRNYIHEIPGFLYIMPSA